MTWQVTGYDKEAEVLQRSLRSGKLSHAYLFSGPAHVGKMTLALWLAQAVNCRSNEPPCGACLSCQRIAEGKHPDVKTISRMSNEAGKIKVRTEISTDDIKDMQRAASLPPYEGDRKVFIIDGAERLSPEAANRLLKTLEEPPPRVLIILLTSRDSALLPTVASRCQRLEMRPVPVGLVRETLVKHYGADPARAELLARLSGGCLGWAVAGMSDADYLERRKQDLTALIKVPSLSYAERFNLVTEWVRRFERSREDGEAMLALWISWWRDVTLICADRTASVTNVDFKPELETQAEEFRVDEALAAANSVLRAVDQLGLNANPRLVLEVLMLNMPAMKAKETVIGK